MLTGTGFGASGLSLSSISVVGKTGVADITCGDVQRASPTELSCVYPLPGPGGCSDTKLYVTVAGQETTQDVPLCYVQDAGSVNLDIDYGAGTVVESATYAYKISLGVPPANAAAHPVRVTVAASPAASCTVQAPATLTFDAANAWSDPQTVRVRTVDDGAFKATDAETYACTLSHTVETQDTTYAALAASTQGSPETRTLSVVSSGCGLGECHGLAGGGGRVPHAGRQGDVRGHAALRRRRRDPGPHSRPSLEAVQGRA